MEELAAEEAAEDVFISGQEGQSEQGLSASGAGEAMRVGVPVKILVTHLAVVDSCSKNGVFQCYKWPYSPIKRSSQVNV